MKALILAAGLGARLRPITDDRPKSLVEINGKPILVKQIENLYENHVLDIIVVAGYKSTVLETEIHSLFPQVKIVVNDKYEETNNMYSAFLTKSLINSEPFLMMNADVFFDSSVIKSLLEFKHPDAIVVEKGRFLGESMKVEQKDGKIIRISKQIEKAKALGVSIDVYKFSSKGGDAFFAKCEDYIEKNKDVNKWSEFALNDILDVVSFKACPLCGRWCEIDNYNDLKEAEEIFA